MTPQEIRSALTAMAAEIGPKAGAHIIISDSYITAVVEPEGCLGSTRLSITFTEWSEALPRLQEAWEAHRNLHASNATKGMALAIIRLTAENGECTDSALRCEFSQQEIDRYGDQAAALATEMGGNGPFEIVRLGVGNMPGAA